MKNHINKLLTLLAISIALLHFTLAKIPKQIEVHFLDVGQGDAILIVTPKLHTILIDGGPGETVLEELGSALPFFMRDIDLMVLTHPHRDHMEGLIEVLHRYQVRYVMLAGDAYGSSLYREFLKSARAKSTIIFADAEKDFSLSIDKEKILHFDILHPISSIAGKEYENTNNASVVMKMIPQDGKTFLFTGDCEEECEHELLANYPPEILKADVLKVGHHGSRTSTTQRFLNAVDPKIAVIQSGKGNQFEHPHVETIEKLTKKNIQILRNDQDGHITLPFP